MDPLKYVFDKPALSGRIARWSMLLTEYDIIFVPAKAVKGQVIADHLAEQPLVEDEPANFDFPDESVMTVEEGTKSWQMYFDGAMNLKGCGVGAVLVSPAKEQYPVSIKLQFPCTNNIAEYEACTTGLQEALEMRIKDLEVFGDSALIICQTNGD
jgi:hypothetical protein